jgi:very-short-patch-repair endonuclease
MAYVKSKTLERARSLRKTLTPAERKLWNAIRARRLMGFKFVRQLPVGPFIADFACREANLIVEVDGDTHSTETERRYDAARTQYLREQGFNVLRFWNDDIYRALPGVCDAILAAIPGGNDVPSSALSGTFSHPSDGRRG